MGRKKRYDTAALVGQLQAERRTGMMLSFAGLGILGLLVLLYFFAGGDTTPEEEAARKMAAATEKTAKPVAEKPPADAATKGAAGAAGDKAPAVAEKEEPAKEPAEKEKPSGPASVTIQMSKKGMVWMGGKKLGKVKSKQLELPVGTHELKAKVGKKMVTHTLEVKGGEKLELTIDHKTRKVTVKEL